MVVVAGGGRRHVRWRCGGVELAEGWSLERSSSPGMVCFGFLGEETWVGLGSPLLTWRRRGCWAAG